MFKPLSIQKALIRLKKIKADFRQQIFAGYEHRAKSCSTCETPGACCLDAHFVNVHISRIEAVNIRQTLSQMPEERQNKIYSRIDATIERYNLITNGDTYSQTYACPLFEKGIGCLIHQDGKPVPCITHACYENASDLPPDELQIKQEKLIDSLDKKTYGNSRPWLPIPLALRQDR
ncbi:MAG: hypothetical protein ABIO36_10405 [Pyrinomonadaceae bacterium]